jgi:hypothetical protein
LRGPDEREIAHKLALLQRRSRRVEVRAALAVAPTEL